MKHQLQRTQQLNCDIHTAWNFFSSPHNLSRITPPEMKFKVISNFETERIYEGMTIDYKISPLLGIQMNWQTIITQVDEQKNFTDFQQKGPYKLWNHLHEFFPNDRGVFMKDTVNYQLPYGVIGDIVHSLMVRKKLEHIFDYRYKVLEKIFNSQTV
jgi:ligand-binding SRPBCC domain-containing protein